ncbi:MAG: HupE/UreJ family protein [Saprospiraceae bacterium]|nr:MAG: HupE/UreJ family protein [Saprospiraceae bacterium]
MPEFFTFVHVGFRHIADVEAYDHLLFVITLCAVYRLQEWKKILVLVTAFTIGHSLTLVLSALDIIRVPPGVVELLIPVTILLTALHNIGMKSTGGSTFSRVVSVNYFLALFFGLIHGMGFSNYFRTLMGDAGNITLPLFSFNVGIELGQMMIVLCFFGALLLLTQFLKIKHREWTLFFSGAGAGVAIILILKGLNA